LKFIKNKSDLLPIFVQTDLKLSEILKTASNIQIAPQTAQKPTTLSQNPAEKSVKL